MKIFIESKWIYSFWVCFLCCFTEIVYADGEDTSERLSRYLFVSTSGNDSNDGLSKSNSLRTIQTAVDMATPGTTVFIKAGNYLDQTVRITKSGTASSPIVLEGYQKVPGDKPRYKKFDHKTKHNPNLLPYLDAGSRTTKKIAIYISAQLLRRARR